MKNDLALWDEGLPGRNSGVKTPFTVTGEHVDGKRSEFAKVQLTVGPAQSFVVEDRVAEKMALNQLDIGWPDAVISGLREVLMVAEPQIADVRVTLEKVWYHDTDSSREAFRNAGRDAGRKILSVIQGSD
jgi:translation elongation factor EF-G